MNLHLLRPLRERERRERERKVKGHRRGGAITDWFSRDTEMDGPPNEKCFDFNEENFFAMVRAVSEKLPSGFMVHSTIAVVLFVVFLLFL